MIRNAVNNILQNKNVLMFMTAIIFMAGILCYFNDYAIIPALILSLICVILIVKNIIPVKYLLFWLFIFYFGFFNAYFRVHTTDDLVSYAPSKSTIVGQVVSIPNSSNELRIRFFFKVFEKFITSCCW